MREDIECDDDGWVLFTGYNSEQIMRRNEMTLISHGNANNVCCLFCLLDFRLLYWELKSFKWPLKKREATKIKKVLWVQCEISTQIYFFGKCLLRKNLIS